MQQNLGFCVPQVFKSVKPNENMKRITILAAMLLFATIGVKAQSADTTVIMKNHEINISDNENEIKIKIFEMKDGTRVSKEPLYESKYQKKRGEGALKRFAYSRGKDELMIMEETDDTKVKSTSRWLNKDLHQALPSLYFAHIEMLDGAFGSFAGDMHQRPSSWEWGIYSPTTIYCTENGRFGFATGWGISNSYNYFQHDWVLAMVDNNSEFMTLHDYSSEEGHGPVNDLAHRTFLRYWSLRIPATMQLQFVINRSYLTFSAGAELEWRIGVRSFARYGGLKHTVSDNLDYNPIGVNAMFQVGYEGVILFARTNLTDFFNSKNLDDKHQLAVGIGFNFD